LRTTACQAARLFRYGGEEIVVLVPLEGAMLLEAQAELLRAALKATRIERADGPPLAVTASFGCAQHDPQEDLPWQKLVERADGALYASKEAGRDRVTVWSFGRK
jgi:diguanylate cyclase (GGDEF)-like protein